MLPARSVGSIHDPDVPGQYVQVLLPGQFGCWPMRTGLIARTLQKALKHQAGFSFARNLFFPWPAKRRRL
jgi:hypothetical protein